MEISKRRYTDEEKRQLIANLDIEVAHRSRQLKDQLDIHLETYSLHQLAQISRIPKQVRNMTMRDFGEKYEGNLQSALRGYQKERLAAAGIDAEAGEIDKSERKRKWVASQEVEAESGSQQALKAARTQLQSPKKAGSSTGPGTAQGSRLNLVNKTPGTTRTQSRIPHSPKPSPQKARPPFNNTTAAYNPHATGPRPVSPHKSHPNPKGTQSQSRVPSSSKFNPMLPPKTPTYPPKTKLNAVPVPTQMRLPRKDENFLSMNGSPLANPYEFGLGWLAQSRGDSGQEHDESLDDGADPDNPDTGSRTAGGTHKLKRTKSNIIIRRDPSVAVPSSLNTDSRADSQLSFYTASENSHSQQSIAGHPPMSTLQSQPNTQSNPLGPFRFPSSRPIHSTLAPSANTHPLRPHAPQTPHAPPHAPHLHPNPPHTPSLPMPLPIQRTRTFSALVAIPTKDGHILEFDPLQTSPSALDALDGITDSAKKQAKVEMGRLVEQAVEKWRIR